MVQNQKPSKFVLLFIFTLIIPTIFSQDIIPIKIGEVYKGDMMLDESHKYYSLTIPKNESNRVLIISTSEDSSINLNLKSSFSDPDFYISKKNKYPSSRKSSEWYSEQYGGDILSIPGESVGENDIFYIGMYCQYKCKYFLKIETGIETDIKLNEFNFLRLKSHETMNYRIKIDDSYDKIKVISYSTSGGKFKIFMNKEAPSSANSYPVIPSWDNGYVIILKRNSKEYCTKCEYHLIVHNEESEDKNEINEIILYVGTEEKDKIINLNNLKNVYDALETNSKICFSFNITEKEKNKEKLILDLVVFSGDATLLIEGWSKKNVQKKIEADNNNYSHKVIMEKHIILDKKDFDYFDKEDPYYENKDSVLNMCLYSQRQISYTFQAYFLTSLEKIKHTSILAQGNKLRGYLLKDQVISYELLIDFYSKKKNNIETNITITETKLVGNTTLYGYYCKDDVCELSTKKDFERIKKKDLIQSTEGPDPYTSILNVQDNDNYCIKHPRTTLKNGNIIDCTAFAIIKCDEPNEENDLCIFDIQFTIKDTELVMKPKQVYDGILSLGNTDKYKIIISDSNIKEVLVVLNTESGNAQLSVYKEKETSYNKESLISISSHNDYIPDVVRITPKKIGQEDLVGKYIIKVFPETFSTYKLYYYTLYKKEGDENDENNRPEVTMNLYLGQLISDYFPNDIRYKIYSFTPLLDRKRNIKIFLNRVNINFNIYAYNDISKFEIVQLFELRYKPNNEPIKGYQWKSNSNNEIIISKNDVNYPINKMLYIVVAPKDPFFTKALQNNNNNNNLNNTEFASNLVSQYYIGIIAESTPITLKEGMPHSMTFNNNYTQQIYHRIHSDLDKNFDIALNVILGNVDVFVSMRYFRVDDIENLDIKSAEYNPNRDLYKLNNFIFKLNVKSMFILSLSSDYIRNNSNYKQTAYTRNAHIYYYIRRSESMVSEGKTCQYILIEKSSETKGEILQPGVIKTGTLKVGNKAYFIIEEIKKRKNAYINVNFKKGRGNLYLRIPNKPEAHNKLRFPDEGYHDYKGKSIYSGRVIQIPEKEYEKLDKYENVKLQFLVTIEALEGSYEFDDQNNAKKKEELQYSISYSNEPKRLNQNMPFEGYLMQGQFEYFNFYFDDDTENIYIGINGMNGDADMYLNKGDELPSMEKSDWRATDNIHEYIDINKDDEFFKKNNQTISGYYTLLLIGFIDTTYSLIISGHKNKVLPLRDNNPMTCWCEQKGEKCFFRYNEVFSQMNKERGINHNEIVFTTDYLYGSGFMYSKVYIENQLVRSSDFYKNFPDKDNYDYSNKESNQRNFIRVGVEEKKYTKDSTILLTFECNERTKVDITSTSLRHFSSVDYISDNRENIYYLGVNDNDRQQSQLVLILNNYIGKNKDLIYSVHSYIGDAHFKVYANTSIWNEKTQKSTFDYKLINEFDVITNDQDQEYNIELYNPYTHDYHNYIPKDIKDKYDDIYFYVEPKTEFGFYITCLFDKNWNKVLLGKSQDFYVVNQELYGYFDINEEYGDVEFSLSVQNNLKMFAELFIKMNIVDRTKITQIQKDKEKAKDEFSLYHYSIPSSENYDYKSVTDKTIGKISLNLNNLPRLTKEDLERGNKFIRALFYVRLGELNFESTPEEENNNNNNQETKKEEKTVINIVVTPGVDSIKYIEVKPFEYYFSNLTYNTPYIKRKVETKIYSLYCENPNHDILIIEISSCYGQYQINIQDELITKDNLNKGSIKYSEFDNHGKKTIIIDDISSKHYYLSVSSKQDDFICKIHRVDPENCGNNLSYLFYYYTAYKGLFFLNDIDKWITHQPFGNGKIKLDLPFIITNDLEMNKKEIKDYKFDVFATKNKDETYRMGSVCYLSRIESNKSHIFKIESMTVFNKTSLILKDLDFGSTYYINVLAQNIKTKELITFQPIEVFTGGIRPLIWRALTFLIIIGLTIILLYFFYKYKTTQDELIFLRGDTLPKTRYEMGNYEYNDSNTVKYSGLGSSY